MELPLVIMQVSTSNDFEQTKVIMSFYRRTPVNNYITEIKS